LFSGISKKPPITYNGKGIRKIIGIKPNTRRNTSDTAEMGIVSSVINNISETYVSG